MSNIDLLLSKDYTLESNAGKIYSSLSRPIIFFDVNPPKISYVEFLYNRHNKFERAEKALYIKELKWDGESKSFVEEEKQEVSMGIKLGMVSYSTKFKNTIKTSVVDNDKLFKSVSSNLQNVDNIETNDYAQFSYYKANKDFDQFTYFGDVQNSDLYWFVIASNSEEFDLSSENTLNTDFIIKNKESENVQQNSYSVSVSRQLRYSSFKNLYSLSYSTNNKKKKINDFVVSGMLRFSKDNIVAKNAFFVELDSDWYLSSEDFTFSNYQMSKLTVDEAFDSDTASGLLNSALAVIFSGGENTESEVSSVFDDIKSYTGTSINVVGHVIRRGEVGSDHMDVVSIVIGSLVGTSIFYSPFAIDQSMSYGNEYVYSVSSLLELQQSYFGESGDLNFGRTYISGMPSKLEYVSAKDFLPPFPPRDFNVIFKKSNAVLNWSMPKDREGKVKKFNLYKRSNCDSPFSLIMQYDFRDFKGVYGNEDEDFSKYGQTTGVRVPSVFTQTKDPIFYHEDNNFSFGDIYAITAVDAHENESNYSQQLMVVQSAGSYSVKPATKMISISGAPLAYPNWFLYSELKNSISEHIEVKGAKGIKLYFDPDARKVVGMKAGVVDNFTNSNNKYVLNIVNTEIMEEKNIDIKISDSKKKT
jgi:hypothetical protein